MYFSYTKPNLDFLNKSLAHQLFAHLDDVCSHSLRELQEIIHSKVIHAVVWFVFSEVMTQLDVNQEELHSAKNIQKYVMTLRKHGKSKIFASLEESIMFLEKT